jgi:WS/DGAT/MGAT family acyltransferase
VVRRPSRLGEELRLRAGAAYRLLADGLQGAPPTLLNPPIGPHRRVHWVSLDLSDVKTAKDALGITVNDLVLATVSGAVRRFLATRPGAAMPEHFRALVPVNVRSDDEDGQLGNRVSLWTVPLPIREIDPLRRIAAIRATTERLKTDRQVLGAEMLLQAAGWTSAGFRNAAARLVSRVRAFNLVVTNVPGPQLPLYLVGAPMVAGYPHVPLFANQALGLALLSYNGTLSWGITADRDHLADIEVFGNALTRSFAELARAAGVSSRLTAPTRLQPRTRHGQRAAKPRRPMAPRAPHAGSDRPVAV